MLKKILPALALAPIIASCAGSQNMTFSKDKSYGVYKIGKPYAVSGITYRPHRDDGYQEKGVASWYGPQFHGKPTANGDKFDRRALTAAHRTLPMPSLVRVTNLDNGKDLVVMVNDRGPFSKSRIIDVSEKAASLLGFKNAGTANVKVTYLKGQTEEMLARMNGGSMPRERAPLRLAKKTDPRSFALAAAKEPQAMPAPFKKAYEQSEPAMVMPAPFAAAYAQPFSSPETPRRAAPFPVAKGDGYYIQAGTFTVSENAERSKEKLQSVAKVASIAQNANGYTAHKVIVGPLGDRQSADRALEDVRRLGFRDAMLIASKSQYN